MKGQFFNRRLGVLLDPSAEIYIKLSEGYIDNGPSVINYFFAIES